MAKFINVCNNTWINLDVCIITQQWKRGEDPITKTKIEKEYFTLEIEPYKFEVHNERTVEEINNYIFLNC